MDFSIVTQKPLWYLIFCIAIGFCYSWLLYRKSDLAGNIRPWLFRLMATLRFVMVTLLSFLLLSPLVKTIFRQTEKPIVIFAQDQSESIAASGTRDSLLAYEKNVEAFIQSLSADYDVRTFSFGDHVADSITFRYNQKQTSFSALFDELNLRFANRNVGAVVVASDGIYNAGSNPLYASLTLNAPVYTIALGDTSSKRDLLITKTEYNRVVFMGNQFTMNIRVQAHQCAGEKTELTVQKDSVVLFRKEIEIAGNNYMQQVPVMMEARQKGINHYRIRVNPLEGELSQVNNSSDVFIEVTDRKLNVLLLAAAPHPDLAAIKSALDASPDFESRIVFAKDWNGNMESAHLVILHQVPGTGLANGSLFASINKSDVPVFYILGARSDLGFLNNLGSGITISESRNQLNEVLAVPAGDFSLFTFSDALPGFINSLPPLMVPFGIYKSNSNIYTLLYQQVGSVRTEQPLLFFAQDGLRKTALLAGEGFWKWRLHDYRMNQSTALTSELIMKTVRYLAIRENKSPFRIIHKSSFDENEPLLFDAELFNESGEPINTPEVRMRMTSASNQTFNFTFSKTASAYTLNAGSLPAGLYRFTAETKSGDKIYSEKGEFSIRPLQVELNDAVADHRLLFELARKNGGAMHSPSTLQSLASEIKSNESIRPVLYSEKKLQDLVYMKEFFFLLMLLITAEWFLRKRSGGY